MNHDGLMEKRWRTFTKESKWLLMFWPRSSSQVIYIRLGQYTDTHVEGKGLPFPFIKDFCARFDDGFKRFYWGIVVNYKMTKTYFIIDPCKKNMLGLLATIHYKENLWHPQWSLLLIKAAINYHFIINWAFHKITLCTTNMVRSHFQGIVFQWKQ